MSAPPSSPHLRRVPVPQQSALRGGDAMVRAFSLCSGGTPLRGWPAMCPTHTASTTPRSSPPRDGLFLCPGSWEGSQGVEGRVWMASRASGDVYRLTLGVKRQED